MKINKFSDTMADHDGAEYVSALKDSEETLVITEVPKPPRKKRRKGGRVH